jgi:hypothetical protein
MAPRLAQRQERGDARSFGYYAVSIETRFLGFLDGIAHFLTQRPPAKAGGLELIRTESPDTRRLNDASVVTPAPS